MSLYENHLQKLLRLWRHTEHTMQHGSKNVSGILIQKDWCECHIISENY